MYIEQNILDKIIVLFKKLGFNKTQIHKLVKKYNNYKTRINILEASYNNYHDNMIKLGYNETAIHELVSDYPRLIFHQFDKRPLRDNYIEYLNNLDEKSNTSDTEEHHYEFEKISGILLDLGVSLKKINTIFTNNLPVIFLSSQELIDNIKFHRNLGMTDSEIVKIVHNNTNALYYGETYYDEIKSEMTSLSMTKADLCAMIKKYSKGHIQFRTDVFKETVKFALSKNVNINKFKKSLKTIILNNTYDEQKLEASYQKLLTIINEDDLNEIISGNIAVLYANYDEISYKIQLLSLLSESKATVIHLIVDFPQILDLSCDNIISKIEVILKHNLVEFVINHPKHFIQSAELTDARACYLKRYYPGMYYSDYLRAVFTTEKHFETSFGPSSAYLKQTLK